MSFRKALFISFTIIFFILVLMWCRDCHSHFTINTYSIDTVISTPTNQTNVSDSTDSTIIQSKESPYFDKGYKDGIKDGKKDEKESKNGTNYNPYNKHYHGEKFNAYISGYDAGYEQGFDNN